MNLQPTIAAKLAQFTAALDYEAVPAAVREQAKLHIMDSIGVAFASSGFDFARKAYSAVARLGAGPYCAIGMPGPLALRDAVLMNGVLVHGLEFDDTSIGGRVHASAFCMPCALGVAELVRASGKRMLTAYVAGMECVVRLGIGARGGFSRAGFNTVGLLGAFGGTLTAGKLLALDPAQLTRAQGIAYSTAAGNREFTAGDSWTKRFEAGWPGVGAVTSAIFAREGYLGPETPYEGKFGLYRNYLPGQGAAENLDNVTAGLGETWELARIMIKMLPSCFFNHPVINATLAVVAAHDLAARDIRSIRVLVPQAAVDTVCEPRSSKVAPCDIAAAQFSVYYSAASAAVRRRFTLDDLDAAAIADPQIQALAHKVAYAVDPDSNFPAHYSGGVEITTVDGRVLTAREDVNAGSVEKPLPRAAIEQKFLANAGRVMTRGRAQEIQDMLLALDTADDVSAIGPKLGAA